MKVSNMPTDLEKLIAAARFRQVSPAERETQRRSFAYGNTSIENQRITRRLVDEQAETIKARTRKS